MGRQKIPHLLKKRTVGVKLPNWLWDFLTDHPRPRGVTIEEALVEKHDLKPPIIVKEEK